MVLTGLDPTPAFRSVRYQGRQNSIDITFAYPAFIFMPLKEAKNIAPGVNPGNSIPRTHKLRRSGTDAFNPTNILDHNRHHVCLIFQPTPPI